MEYRVALALCPPAALTDLRPIHNALGLLYMDVGLTERALEHCEKCVQLAEQAGDCYRAGASRFNIAVMYLGAAERESASARKRDFLQRPQAYAKPPCATTSTTKASPLQTKPTPSDSSTALPKPFSLRAGERKDNENR